MATDAYTNFLGGGGGGADGNETRLPTRYNWLPSKQLSFNKQCILAIINGVKYIVGP